MSRPRNEPGLRGSPSAALVVLEEGAEHPPPAESAFHAFASATITLTLGILGSSVLPVPFAFSRMGVALGLATALVVALANAYTGTLIIRAAGAAHKHSFEALAEAVGGRAWKVVTQVSLVVLLFGTLCGDYALLADTGSIAVSLLFPEAAPAWLTMWDGRVIMLALAALVVFPLSCLRKMRQLERAAMAGVGLVAVLAAVIVHEALQAGLPAIRSGELPVFSFKLDSKLAESVAVLSFSFYLQPMLLPMLREMPIGQLGVDLTCKATQLVTCVVAYVVYAIIGVFAAARYGRHTEGDVLVNEWLPGRWDGALDALMALYLSISMVPIAITLRYQLDSLFFGEDVPTHWRRELSLTALCLLSSLAVALAFPTASERIFAVTGASGVCLVCYVIPVLIHLRLFLSGWKGLGARASSSTSLFSKDFSFGQGLQGQGQALRSSPWSQGGSGSLAGGSDATVWLLAGDHHASSLSSAALPAHIVPGEGLGPAEEEQAAAAAAAAPGRLAGLQLGLDNGDVAAAATMHSGRQFGSHHEPSLNNWLPSRGSASALSLTHASSPSFASPPLVGSSDSLLHEDAVVACLAGWDEHISSSPSAAAAAAGARSGDFAHSLLGGRQRGRQHRRQQNQRQLQGQQQPLQQQQQPLLPAEAPYPTVQLLERQGLAGRTWVLCTQVGLPLLVMLLGCGFSLMALWLSIAPLLQGSACTSAGDGGADSSLLAER